MGFIIHCLFVALLSQIVKSTFKNIGVSVEDFYIPGDINIAYIDSFYLYSSVTNQCDKDHRNRLQTAEAAQYRIRQVNQDASVLPNISLGMVFLTDCNDVQLAIFQATKLLPTKGLKENCCLNKDGNATATQDSYSVSAALISPSSDRSIPMSRLLSMYKIPHISTWATSDTLSDKTEFEYFSRTVPPDHLQTQAIIDLLVAFNWTYVSMIGQSNDYSRNGIARLRQLAEENGICIAYFVEISPGYEDEDYDNIIRQLRINKKAHVVVTFIDSSATLDIWSVVMRQKVEGEFVFMGGDSMNLDHEKEAINSIGLYFSLQQSHPYNTFEKYYDALFPWSFLNKPSFFETTVQSYLAKSECNITIPKLWNGSCLNYERMDQLPGYELSKYHREVIDGLNIFISSLDTLIRRNCPSAFFDKSSLQACLKGPDLLKIVRSSSSMGYAGKVQFDKHGDGIKDYDILQRQPDEKGIYKTVVIGQWLHEEKKLELNMETVKWFTFNTTLHPTATQLPESVCAKPCQAGEFYIPGELKCCWECRSCRDNEIVRDDFRGCIPCPVLTWPDQANFMACVPIPPTYLHWLDPIALGLLTLSGAGLLSTMAIILIFIKYRKKKVVKGSSVEQMATIIIALLMSYANAILFIEKPTWIVCKVQYYSYRLSCSLTFVPLFLKTTRLYRIFAAAERCQQEIKCVSSTALRAFSIILITCVVSIFHLINCISYYNTFTTTFVNIYLRQNSILP